MLHNVAFDQGHHCLPLIQQFLDKCADSKMDLFKSLDKNIRRFQIFRVNMVIQRIM